jgi:hypothetical protein
MTAPERIWAASVTENYGEWQTTTDGLPRPTEYVRADLVMARCSSCDGTGDVHRADGEWLGECDCGCQFRHAYDVEASPSKAFRVIQGQAARIAALEAQLAERVKVDDWDVERTADDIARDLAAIKDGRIHGDTYNAAKAGALAALKCASAALSALEATPPAPKVTEAMVKAGHAAMMSELFLVCQPDRGDVFSFMDDRPEIIQIAITAAQEAGK